MREFRELVLAHQARIYSLAFRIVGDSGLAEEVAQDAFLALYGELEGNPGRVATEEHALAWLRRTAVHRATDALRRRARRAEFGAEVFHDEVDAGWTRTHGAGKNGAASPVLASRVERLVMTLPETQRAVVLLRYQEDMLPEEIASALAMPVATVKSHLQRALQLLRTKAERTLKEFNRVRN